MDAFLAAVSKRDTRRYADRPVPDDVRQRTLEAGRLAGSAVNRQPWRFLVVENAERRERLAETVYEPTNVRGAQLVVAIAGKSSFDTGRCAQNMMLAAWNDGVASCPNGMPDRDRAAEALGLGDDDGLAVVLTFGYPANGRRGEDRPVEEWIRRANRKPLSELVEVI